MSLENWVTMDWLGPFLLGALVSIPVGVLANVLTPRFEVWWSSRSETRQAQRDARERDFDTRARVWIAHPYLFTHYLVIRLTASVTLGLMALGSGVLAILSWLLAREPVSMSGKPIPVEVRWLSLGLVTFMAFFAMVSVVVGYTFFRRTMASYRRVQRMRRLENLPADLGEPGEPSAS